MKQKAKFAELDQLQERTLQDTFLRKNMGIAVKCKCSELNSIQFQYLFMNYTTTGFKFNVTETFYVFKCFRYNNC